MKYILITVVGDHTKGGAEQYLKMLAEHFLRKRYAVDVFFFKKSYYRDWEAKEDTNLKLYYNHTSKSKLCILLSYIINIINNRKTNYDYAFTSHVECSSFIGLLRKLGFLKINYFVGRESTSIFKRFSGWQLFQYKIYYYLGYSAIDLLICQTGYMKRQLLENLPWLEKKVRVEVIPNPVHIENMTLKAQEYIDFNFENSFIVSAGRFIPAKGFDILIKTFAKLRLEYNELKLLILGDGKERELISGIIKELGLEDYVILYGFADNVYPFFKNAKMCVVSSRIEGFPNVLLQMMSQNEKVVSTLCAGDIDKVKGLFTCKTHDEEDLLRAMKQCLEADTTQNREVFDKELQSRSIDVFINKVTEGFGNKI
jgi:glycosyltransferase involved in cell wall biosynthesis